MNKYFIGKNELLTLIELMGKGLTEEKTSKISKMPISFIRQYFDKMNELHQKSGVF